MKTILKFAYIAFALVIGFVVGFFGYYSNGYQYYNTITQNAINNNDYIELAMIHGGCFSKVDTVVEKNDKVEIAIIPSAVDYTVDTFSLKEGSTTEYVVKSNHFYEAGYYFYIVKANFDTDNFKQGDKICNNTAIRFFSSTTFYDYLFNKNETVNTYDEHPETVNKALLDGSRTSSNFYEAYGFYNFDISKTLIDAIEEKIGDVTGFAIIDSLNEKNQVITSTFSFNFEEDFFDAVKPLIEAYNKYLLETESGVEGAADRFNEFYNGDGTNGFYSTFVADGKYSFRHADNYLQPASLIWQTVGMVSLFLLAAALIYLLLFHFNLFKKLYAKLTGKGGNEEYSYKPRTYKKTEAIDATVTPIKPIRHVETKNEVIDAKITSETETVNQVEETKEEASTKESE